MGSWVNSPFLLVKSPLLGGIPTPLKHMKVSWDDFSQLNGKSKKHCSKLNIDPTWVHPQPGRRLLAGLPRLGIGGIRQCAGSRFQEGPWKQMERSGVIKAGKSQFLRALNWKIWWKSWDNKGTYWRFLINEGFKHWIIEQNGGFSSKPRLPAGIPPSTWTFWSWK